MYHTPAQQMLVIPCWRELSYGSPGASLGNFAIVPFLVPYTHHARSLGTWATRLISTTLESLSSSPLHLPGAPFLQEALANGLCFQWAFLPLLHTQATEPNPWWKGVIPETWEGGSEELEHWLVI